MKKPKIVVTEKPATKAKTGKPVAIVVTEAKPIKPDSAKKSSNKMKSVASKPVAKAKVERPIATVYTEEKTIKLAAQKSSNKPKTTTPKPAPKAKPKKLVTTVVTVAKPNKTSGTQKSPKKAKAASPKTLASTKKRAIPERVKLQADNIWPNWVEQLLVSFGIKTK